MSTPFAEPRPYLLAAHDRLRGRVVTGFGAVGDEAGPRTQELWEWCGTDCWRNRTPSATWPTSAAFGGMAYLPQRRTTVLYGGDLGPLGERFSGDTWLWRGNAWSALQSTSPPPRDRLSMTVMGDGRSCLADLAPAWPGATRTTWGTPGSLKMTSGGHGMEALLRSRGATPWWPRPRWARSSWVAGPPGWRTPGCGPWRTVGGGITRTPQHRIPPAQAACAQTGTGMPTSWPGGMKAPDHCGSSPRAPGARPARTRCGPSGAASPRSPGAQRRGGALGLAEAFHPEPWCWAPRTW